MQRCDRVRSERRCGHRLRGPPALPRRCPEPLRLRRRERGSTARPDLRIPRGLRRLRSGRCAHPMHRGPPVPPAHARGNRDAGGVRRGEVWLRLLRRSQRRAGMGRQLRHDRELRGVRRELRLRQELRRRARLRGLSALRRGLRSALQRSRALRPHADHASRLRVRRLLRRRHGVHLDAAVHRRVPRIAAQARASARRFGAAEPRRVPRLPRGLRSARRRRDSRRGR